MSLIPVDAEYHYVQDTAPTTAHAGDVWLDTSQNQPVSKIYADVGNGLEWLVDQSSDRIATNLDAPVSEAGQGVDWASKTVDRLASTPVTQTVIVGANPSGGGTDTGSFDLVSGGGYWRGNYSNITVTVYNRDSSDNLGETDVTVETRIDGGAIYRSETIQFPSMQNGGSMTETFTDGFKIPEWARFDSAVEVLVEANWTDGPSDDADVEVTWEANNPDYWLLMD